LPAHANPLPTVDVLLHVPGRGVLLVERRNPPPGWALPGGFVDAGETVEQAAVREAREETGLEVELTGLFGVYSDPGRDPRRHTLSVVFTAQARDLDRLAPGDDAGEARFFPLDALPETAFDHGRILGDFALLHARLNAGQGQAHLFSTASSA
jgi:8-oxo-dGTP diphosphatase